MIKIDTFYIKMVHSLKLIIVPFPDFIGVLVLIGLPECYLF